MCGHHSPASLSSKCPCPVSLINNSRPTHIPADAAATPTRSHPRGYTESNPTVQMAQEHLQPSGKHGRRGLEKATKNITPISNEKGWLRKDLGERGRGKKGQGERKGKGARRGKQRSPAQEGISFHASRGREEGVEAPRHTCLESDSVILKHHSRCRPSHLVG